MDKTDPEYWMETAPDKSVWELLKKYACRDNEHSAALLALRSRIELLEAARAVRDTSSAGATPRSDDRLLPLLEKAIAYCAIGTAHEAALRCVADWLERQDLEHSAFAIRMELP